MTEKPKAATKNKKSQQVALRMPMALLKRIDSFAADLQQQSPGLRISRADAIRVMIENWLAKVEADKKLPANRQKE